MEQTSDRAPNARETALYTYEMLISLRKLAANREQSQLAALIAAAAREAYAIIRKDLK